MVDINISAGVKGRYTTTRRGPDGSIRGQLCFDNLILNSGIDDLFSTDNYMVASYIYLGTGTLPEEPTQTGMVQVARISGVVASWSSKDILGGSPYVIQLRRTVRFTAGSATGTFYEVGCGRRNDNTNLFSRSLIRDVDGEPTSLTVLSDETLDVTYDLYVHIDVSDRPFTLTLSTGSYDGVLRPIGLTSYPGLSFSYGLNTSPTDGRIGRLALQSPETPVSGTGVNVNPAVTRLLGAYTPGQGYRDIRYTVPLAGGNNYGEGIPWMSVESRTFYAVQMTFDPPVPKNAERVFTITLRYSFSRL